MSLNRYLLRRILVLVPVLLGVSFVTFAIVHMLPGGPIRFLLQFQDASPELVEELRRDLNLHEPLWKQYLLWLQDVILLDFGDSFISGRPVGATVGNLLPYSLLLGVCTFVVTLATAIPAGIYAAMNKGTTADELSRIGALLGVATPNFWLGLLFIYAFAVELGWFQVVPPIDAPLLSFEVLKFMVLPAVTLGTSSTALIMRLLRTSMVEELSKEYVTAARAKGLSERTIIFKHVLRNSLISVVTVAALQVATIVSGAVVIEEVFSWPGLGQLLVSSVTKRDIPMLQAIVLLVAVSVVIANLLADVVYAWLDPRIRY